MAFTYNIATTKKDKTSSLCLTATHAVHKITELFISTFLVAHIYSLSGSNIMQYVFNVGVYYFVTYLTMSVVCWALIYWIERTNRVWFFRASLVLLMSLVILYIFKGQDIAKILPLAGFLYGLGSGLYYSSYNSLKQEMVSRNSMKKYILATTVINNSISIVVPIIMGTLIDASTFSQVAIYVCVISIIQIGVSFGIRAQRPQGSNFSFIGYRVALKQNPQVYKKMKLLYVAFLFYGITSITGVLAKVCIMIHMGTSFSLGAVTSVLSVVTIIGTLAFARFSQPGKRSYIFILGMVVAVAGVLVFALVPNKITTIAFYASTTIAGIINDYTIDRNRNSTLKEAGLYDQISEHQTAVELILGLSRIVTFGLLILLASFGTLNIFTIALVIFALISNPVVLLLMMIYDKKYAIIKDNSGEQDEQTNSSVLQQPGIQK